LSQLSTASSSAAHPQENAVASTFETARFGVVAVQPERLFEFVQPILGFEDCRLFLLLDGEGSDLYWLQSLEKPELAFVVTTPPSFGIDYTFEIPPEAAKTLTLSSAEDVIVLTLVTIPESNPAKMTTNLLGPLILNIDNHRAMQVVLADAERYSTRHPLLPPSAFAEETA
jgi:flagellar assembly factor FliW